MLGINPIFQFATEKRKSYRFPMNKKLSMTCVSLLLASFIARADKPVYASGNFNGHGYELIPTLTPWHIAKKKANDAGGYLVAVTSAEENKFIIELTKKATKGESCDTWLGLSDEKNERDWKWVNGEKYSFSNWQPNQPDNAGYWAGSENCVHLQQTQSGFGWNDYSGDARFVYIIEYDHEIDSEGGKESKGAKANLRSTR